MVSWLYRIARWAAWGRALGKLAEGNPMPLARRARNKYLIYKPLNKITRR